MKYLSSLSALTGNKDDNIKIINNKLQLLLSERSASQTTVWKLLFTLFHISQTNESYLVDTGELET